MFLESLTVSGFLGVANPKKFSFETQDLSQNFNEIPSDQASLFLKAFSVIFDPRLSEDLQDLTNSKHKGESFIEIVLWQNDEEKIEEHLWFQENRLVLRRNLKEPESFLVNNIKLSAERFHRSFSSLGFLKTNDLLLQCLVEKEILQLSRFTPEDLWGIIQQLNCCKELVQIIEIRHLSKIIARDQIQNQISEVEIILPKKLKLRDDFRAYNRHSKRFKTLMSIIDNRKLQILDQEKGTINEAVKSIKLELHGKSEEFKAKIEEISLLLWNQKSNSKVIEMLEEKSEELHVKIQLFPSDQDNKDREIFEKFHGKALTSSENLKFLIDEVDSNEIFKTRANYAEILWKLEFKQNPSSARKDLQNHLTNLRKVIDFLSKQVAENDEQIIFYQDNIRIPEALIGIDDRVEILEQILDHHMEIVSLKKQIFGTEQKIGLYRITNHYSYVETLLVIEKVMQQHHEITYIGPVFKYLRPHPEVDVKTWPILEKFAKRFLFIEGKHARKANRILIENEIITGSYEFVGLDEFIDAPVSRDDDDEILSAEILVRADIEDELKNQLRAMLQGILLAEVGEEIENQENVIIHNDGCFTLDQQGKLDFQVLDPTEIESPIEKLHKIYKIILNCCELELKVEMEGEDKTKLGEILKNESSINVSLIVMALDQIKDGLEERFEILNRFSEAKAMQESLQPLMTWDAESSSEKSLKSVKQTMKPELEANEELFEKFNLKVKNSLKKLEIVTNLIRSMENLEFPLEAVMSAELTVRSKYQERFNEMNQELEDLKKLTFTDESEEMKITADTLPTDLHETNLQEQVFEIKNRLKAKFSEKVAIDVAMEHCKISSNIDEEYYKKFSEESIEKICEELQTQKQTLKGMGHIPPVTHEQYGHLVTTINKIRKYSESPVPFIARNKLASKSYPIMNKFFVKTLKDVVQHYQTSFKYVTSNFIRKSQLFFYTRDHFEEINSDNFSWDCFDMNQIKSMDFCIDWKRNAKIIDVENLRKIKGLLLIMHIVNYMSVFKFIIIDESLFENMDEILAENVKTFLKTVSAFVQVFVISKENKEEDEPMEISE